MARVRIDRPVYFTFHLLTNPPLAAGLCDFTGSVIGAFLLLLGMAWVLVYAVRRGFSRRRGAMCGGRRWRICTVPTIRLVSSLFLSAWVRPSSAPWFWFRTYFSNASRYPRVEINPTSFSLTSRAANANEVLDIAKKQGLPVIQSVPIVNMRLEQINGYTATAVQKDTSIRYSNRLFGREYRVTFRDTLTEFEKIKKGSWQGKVTPGELVPISMEEGYALRGNIDIGDTLVFNVQGALLPTVVRSFREVDWQGVRTNFLVIFPTGVLEEAPQFHVLLTRVPSSERSANFQQAIVQRFPNISIIDLGLVLKVLDELLEKIGFVIRFMAGFSILTGLIVLISSVLISKYQRLQESVLLRTLGASRRQIFTITALEYFFLGSLAAATGILVALAGSWALARYSFEVDFTPQFLPLLAVFLCVAGLTVLIGLANSRGIVSRSPLEVLRQDV